MGFKVALKIILLSILATAAGLIVRVNPDHVFSSIFSWFVFFEWIFLSYWELKISRGGDHFELMVFTLLSVAWLLYFHFGILRL